MTWKAKLGIAAGVVALVGLLLCIVKFQYDIIQKQNAIEKSFVEQRQLEDNIIRSQASYVTKKDLERFAKDAKVDLGPIKEDLKKLDAKIKGIQTVRVISSGYQGDNISSTDTTPNLDPKLIDPSNPDPFGYRQNRQVLKLEEPFGEVKVPFGEAGFSAWQKEPWDLKIKQREYNVVNVLGMDENGRHYTYSKFSVNVDGQKYDLKVSDSQFKEEYPKSKFRFNPRLYAGVDGGAYFTDVSGAVVPNLQMAFFSYGKTKTLPEWTFLGLGLGYESVQKDLAFVLSPVYYNIGMHLLFVENIHIRPTLMLTPKGDLAIMAGFGFGL